MAARTLSAADVLEVDRVLGELVAIAGSEGALGLRQFRSRTSAHQYRRLYRATLEHVPRGGRVLDWGSGNGHFSYALAELGYRPTSYSFEALPLRAHMRRPCEAVLGASDEPVRLPFGPGEFDAVVSVGVLEHVRETGGQEQGSLREIARVLRPDGRFLCYHFPNRWSAIEALAAHLPGAHHHQRRYSPGDIRFLCEGAGLELVARRRYGILPRNVLGRLPTPLRLSCRFARAWDALDSGLERPLALLAQNHLFVARKPAG